MAKKIQHVNGVGLQEVVKRLKEDILSLEQEAKNNKNPVFELGDTEIELSVGVEAQIEGGFKIWVVNVGGKIKHEEIHKIKIKLHPVNYSQNEQLTDSAKPQEPKHLSGGGGRRLFR